MSEDKEKMKCFDCGADITTKEDICWMEDLIICRDCYDRQVMKHGEKADVLEME